MTGAHDRTADDASSAHALSGEITAPHLFLVLECARPLAGGARHLLSEIDEVVLGRGATRGVVRDVDRGARRLTVRVPDRRMSGEHARITRVGDAFAIRDLGSTNGTRICGALVEGTVRLRDGDTIELGHTLFRFRDALPTTPTATGDVDASDLDGVAPGLATLLPTLVAQLETVRTVARSTIPILLLGETGTGKDVLARAIHGLSGREGAFVAVNCGALTATLVESQLFGHIRGAFSGATRDEPGLVRAADGGTLFLDEIGDLPKATQTALLRVLQEREVVPVGSTRPVKVDLRVIAATHAAIDVLSTSGEFRSDLFARLAGFTHRLTPLRDRREDLGLLIASILRQAAAERASELHLSAEVGRAFLAHDWPLNVRELAQSLTLGAVMATDGVIRTLPSLAPPARSSSAPRLDWSEEDERLHRELVERLAEHHGNVTDVAQAMGKARVQIYRWMRRFGLDQDKFRG